jgi:hypothetical protein
VPTTLTIRCPAVTDVTDVESVLALLFALDARCTRANAI